MVRFDISQPRWRGFHPLQVVTMETDARISCSQVLWPVVKCGGFLLLLKTGRIRPGSPNNQVAAPRAPIGLRCCWCCTADAAGPARLRLSGQGGGGVGEGEGGGGEHHNQSRHFTVYQRIANRPSRPTDRPVLSVFLPRSCATFRFQLLQCYYRGCVL